MKILNFTLLVLLFGIASCNNNNHYESSKESLYDVEKEAPLEFLSITENNKRNLLGQTVVRTVVKNKASICTYDKVRIKFLYFDFPRKYSYVPM